MPIGRSELIEYAMSRKLIKWRHIELRCGAGNANRAMVDSFIGCCPGNYILAKNSREVIDFPVSKSVAELSSDCGKSRHYKTY